jgi:mRNA interferase MazF
VTGQFYRGEVYAANFPDVGEEKYWVVVSNNGRNRGFEDALVVRVTTTTPKPHPSWAVLPRNECVQGAVVCDDIVRMYPEDNPRRLGALSQRAMDSVNAGLKAALGLS